jgi:hypothetical protein
MLFSEEPKSPFQPQQDTATYPSRETNPYPPENAPDADPSFPPVPRRKTTAGAAVASEVPDTHAPKSAYAARERRTLGIL